MKQWIRWVISFFCLIIILAKGIFPDFFLRINSFFRLDTFTVVLLAVLFFSIGFPYISKVTLYLTRMDKRIVIILVCLILVVLGLAFPAIELTDNIIWLIGIAALMYVLPEIKSLTHLLKFIKRLKIGAAELELRESIKDLEKVVERVQETEDLDLTRKSDVIPEIEMILEESSKDPRAALLLLSAKIEQQLKHRLREAGIHTKKYISMVNQVKLGVEQQIFPPSFLPAFMDFWAIRNKVAHGAAFDVDDAYIFSLISLGTKLLEIASTSKVPFINEGEFDENDTKPSSFDARRGSAV